MDDNIREKIEDDWGKCQQISFDDRGNMLPFYDLYVICNMGKPKLAVYTTYEEVINIAAKLTKSNTNTTSITYEKIPYFESGKEFWEEVETRKLSFQDAVIDDMVAKTFL